MSAFEILVRQEAEKVVKNSACVFSAPARVISVEGNQKYKVQLVTSEAQYTVMNYSGSDLQVGEAVQLFYRGNVISNQTAYIGASLKKTGYTFTQMTQEEYDNMVSHDANMVYFIIG